MTDDRIEQLQRQLPAEMQDCTILFKQCEKGHGWLTATNWEQHGCPTCEREQLQRERSAMIDNVRFARERAERAEAEVQRLRTEFRTLKVAIDVGMPEFGYYDWIDIIDAALREE